MSHWYVIHSKARQELIAQENLERQGFKTFLPLIACQKRKAAKKTSVIEPLFPRYLFVSFQPGRDNIASIKYTRGVSKMVSFGMEFATIPESIVQRLIDDADERGVISQPELQMKLGDHLRIITGPLEGQTGTLHEMTGDERVVLLMNILGQERQITIHADQLDFAVNY